LKGEGNREWRSRTKGEGECNKRPGEGRKMNSECRKWKDQLLDAALSDARDGEFQKHLATCSKCAEELELLRARAVKMDAMLPLIASGADLQEYFAARVLHAANSATEALPPRRQRILDLAALTTVLALGIGAGLWMHQKTVAGNASAEIAAAGRLAHWQAPSDALLGFPGAQILRDGPQLGQTYLQIPLATGEIGRDKE
jgi:hypothetical protein